MDNVKIKLINDEVITVKGGVPDVEKKLSDGARSGQARLVWFDEADGGSVGINPAHVVTLRVD
jgi:hypothetical protein